MWIMTDVYWEVRHVCGQRKVPAVSQYHHASEMYFPVLLHCLLVTVFASTGNDDIYRQENFRIDASGSEIVPLNSPGSSTCTRCLARFAVSDSTCFALVFLLALQMN